METGAFGGAGGLGAAGVAESAVFAGGVVWGDGLAAGLSPASLGGVCCSLGSSAMDPEHYGDDVNFPAIRQTKNACPVATNEAPSTRALTPPFLTHGKSLVNHKNLGFKRVEAEPK